MSRQFQRSILGVVAVFVTWSITDFLIHGLLLDPIYQATAELWRPIDEIKMAPMYATTLAAATCFVMVYAHFVARKSLIAGIKLGALFGLATGISMGFGSYSYMPIPLTLAWSWFFEALVSCVIAGALVGAIVKPKEETPEAG